MQIKDRVFIVTGASSGIGLATAVALSGRGAGRPPRAEHRGVGKTGATASRQPAGHRGHDAV